MVILRAEEISKTFYTPQEIPVLRKINLVAHQGEAIAITGRSGEGKSTLLQILGTLETPCGGHLEIANQPVTYFNKNRIRNRHLSFVFQTFYLLEDYTALENILMPARIARQNTAKGSQAYHHAMNLLEHVGMKNRAYFHTKLLSGGEKQRIAIARALCNHPDLLLADEPSGNLDKGTATIIHQLLLEYVRQHQKTLIVVTHDEELAKKCDTIYFLHEHTLQLRS